MRVPARVGVNNGDARFAVSGDGVATDLVGGRDAISLGHYPACLDHGRQIAAQTFHIDEKDWEAMSPAEQRARNQHLLDAAISRGECHPNGDAPFERSTQHRSSRGD